jgi:hypothetical protein
MSELVRQCVAYRPCLTYGCPRCHRCKGSRLNNFVPFERPLLPVALKNNLVQIPRKSNVIETRFFRRTS